MASTYTNSLQIQQIGNGEQSGTWGTTTNTNMGLIDQAVAGATTITMSNANHSLTQINGTSDEARNMILEVVGTNSGVYQIVVPYGTGGAGTGSKMYTVYNNTTGGYAITIGYSGGSTVSIPNGYIATVFGDGTNFFAANTTSAGSFNVNGTLTASGVADVGNLSVSGTTTLTGTATAPTVTPSTDSSTKIATTAFVASAITSAVITGTISMWPVSSAPTGYLVCNGSAVSRTTYSALFSVIGTTFGSGDGSTTFNLPNYADRMPIGVGTISSGSGVTGGASTTTIGLTNLPAHTHSITDPGHNHTYGLSGNSNQSLSGGPSQANLGVSTTNTGTASTGITATNNTQSGGTAFANTAMTTISPYLGIYFIIKT